MDKCGVCGKEIKKKPVVTSQGQCSECNEKLKMEKQTHKR
jgi:predicted nucleic acid-binding Zn ribbon protein